MLLVVGRSQALTLFHPHLSSVVPGFLPSQCVSLLLGSTEIITGITGTGDCPWRHHRFHAQTCFHRELMKSDFAGSTYITSPSRPPPSPPLNILLLFSTSSSSTYLFLFSSSASSSSSLLPFPSSLSFLLLSTRSTALRHKAGSKQASWEGGEAEQQCPAVWDPVSRRLRHQSLTVRINPSSPASQSSLLQHLICIY